MPVRFRPITRDAPRPTTTNSGPRTTRKLASVKSSTHVGIRKRRPSRNASRAERLLLGIHRTRMFFAERCGCQAPGAGSSPSVRGLQDYHNAIRKAVAIKSAEGMLKELVRHVRPRRGPGL
jgi:hypothetical protein